MANLRNILLRISGDPDPAREAMREIADDVRDFGRLSAEARVDIATQGAKAQLEDLYARLERLKKQDASPAVQIRTANVLAQIERVEKRLGDLGRQRVDVDIDVNRGIGETLAATARAGVGAVGAAAGAAVGGVQTLIGALTSLGPLVTGLGIAIGVALLPALVALGASLATAAAGAGALGVAFAGALGPAVLVVVAALARVVQIVQAVKREQEQGAAAAEQAAAATRQVAAANEQVAAAQQNVRDQAVAAYQAYADAVERVKDGLLAVEQAQLGIDSARLGIREAQQALRDFRRESGTSDGSLDGLFKKFTDVDFQGDAASIRNALAGAGGAAGGLSESDQLRLERLILNVRQAKLREKQATDELGDSTRQLARDRRTEAEFAREGIRAYAPYEAALRQTTQAQRAAADAQRSLTAARRRAADIEGDLTAGERRFGLQLLAFGTALRRAFSPALAEVMRGASSAIRSITRAVSDPAVAGGLRSLGRAIGDTLANVTGRLTGREFRDGFAELARAGGRLVRIFGSSVFADLATILLRIARAALPEAVRLAREFARWLGRIADRTKDTDALRAGIRRLVSSFRDWLGVAREVGRVILAFFGALAPQGDSLARTLQRILRRFAEWLESKEGREELKDFFNDVLDVSKAFFDVLGFIIRRLRDIVNILRPVLEGLGKVKEFADKVPGVGDKGIGGLPKPPFSLPSPGDIIGAGKGIIGGLLGNSAQPGGAAMQNLTAGLGGFNAVGRSATPAFATTGSFGGGMRIDRVDVNVSSPPGTAPDPAATGIQIERELRRRGRAR